MIKSSPFLKSLAALALLLPSLGSADEARVPVGEPKEIVLPVDPEEEGSFSEETLTGSLNNEYPSVYYPASCHWMMKVSAFGDSLEIEDGSVWEINSKDGSTALKWKMKDPLTITQNSRWFSKHNYKVVNTTNSQSIEVNLKLGPYENGQYTYYITFMDRRKGEVGLTDGSNWEICKRDVATFRNWREGQAVIIGVNSGWESSYNILLINVNMNEFIRVKQF